MLWDWYGRALAGLVFVLVVVVVVGGEVAILPNPWVRVVPLVRLVLHCAAAIVVELGHLISAVTVLLSAALVVFVMPVDPDSHHLDMLTRLRSVAVEAPAAALPAPLVFVLVLWADRSLYTYQILKS